MPTISRLPYPLTTFANVTPVRFTCVSNRKHIPTAVLMYHGINAPSETGIYNPVYSVSQTVFKEHLSLMTELGCDFVASRDESTGSFPVSMTFDDGDRSNYTVGFPLCVEHGVPGEFYVTSSWIDKGTHMSVSMLREMHQQGMLIGAHGHTHRYLSDLDDNDLADELERSKAIIEQAIGDRVQDIALPGGRGGKRVERACQKAGFTRVLTSKVGYQLPRKNHLLIPRFSISAKTSTSELEKIISRDRGYLLKQSARKFSLDCGKLILGNKRYEKLRKRVLR